MKEEFGWVGVAAGPFLASTDLRLTVAHHTGRLGELVPASPGSRTATVEGLLSVESTIVVLRVCVTVPILKNRITRIRLP
jgi:hypothetical protein